MSQLKKPKKRKRKINYKKKALEKWSTVIRQVGKCEMCGRKGIKGETQGWKNLDAHHLIPKGSSVEYCLDLSNGICLCTHCHQWHKQLSPHQNIEGFEDWLFLNRSGQWVWYEENYPRDTEKTIGGHVIMCRTVKKTGLRMNYKEVYEVLKAMAKQ